MIPAGWRDTKIGEICELINGRGFKPHEWKAEGLPIIRIQNLNGSSDFNYYSGDYDPKIEVEEGQLLFAWSGSRGTSFGPHIWNGPKAVLNYHTWKVQAREGCDNNFLLHLLRHLTVKIESSAHGAAALVHTQKGEMENFAATIPPFLEQQRIAEILSTWDRAAETVEALIANARAQKKALMQSLLTGKKRLPGFSGEWAKAAIGDVAVEVSERAGDQADMPVLSCSKHDGIVLSLTYFKKKVYSDDTSNYKVMRRGAFGFPSNHVEEGSIGYQDICDAGIVSPIYCVFRSNGSIDDGFFYKLLKTDRYRQIFAAATNASVDRRGSLRWKEFSKIEIPLPSSDEQKAISRAIDAADEAERAYARQLTALKQEKAALMQQLLTGKRRVKVDEREAA